MYILLTERSDRLGSNMFLHLSRICLAIENKYYIYYNKNIKYSNIPYVKALLDYSDDHNRKLFIDGVPLSGKKIPSAYIDMEKILSKSVLKVQSDFISYLSSVCNFKTRIHKFLPPYSLPYDPRTTIVVHMRLDDVSKLRSNAIRSANVAINCLNKDKCVSYLPFYKRVSQSPIREEKIQELIEIAMNEDKGKTEVVIVTTLGEKLKLPYKNIGGRDVSEDIYFMSMAEVFIASKSTYSTLPLFFGNHKKVYYPIWDHGVFIGLNTKFDKTSNITYVEAG